MAKPPASVLDKVITLCKSRGFVYPCGDIYGGTRSAWDYGPLGVELKENLKRQWWKFMVTGRDDVVGLDSSVILPRRNWEAFFIAAPLTFLLAFSFRHLLPERSEQFWIGSGLAAVLGGSLGDLVLSVIRRDLGIKDVGVFIIGRGDLLSVMDRLIFVAPIFYYVMWYLETRGGIVPHSIHQLFGL